MAYSVVTFFSMTGFLRTPIPSISVSMMSPGSIGPAGGLALVTITKLIRKELIEAEDFKESDK